MSRTSIPIISGYQLPDTYISKGNPVRTDLTGEAWRYLTLELSLAVGSSPVVTGSLIKLYYAFSNSVLDPVVATTSLTAVGELSGIINGRAAGLTQIVSSQVEITGDYLYTWISVPDPISGDVVVTLDAVEVVTREGSDNHLPYNAGTVNGTVVLDRDNGTVQKIAITGDLFLASPINGFEGALLEIWVTPNSGYGLTIADTISGPSDVEFSWPRPMTANHLYIVLLQHTGTNWMLRSLVGWS